MYDSLDHPDLPAWHGLPDYSYDIAARLRRAYLFIGAHADQLASYLHAAREVQRMWDQRMADPQRLRVCYVLALAYAADAQSDRAFLWVEQGIELAEKLQDIGALVHLLYLRGMLSFSVLAFADATDDFVESRLLLRALSDHGPHLDPSMELQLLLREANMRSFMGQIDHTHALLAVTRTLLAEFSGHMLESATILWLEANMLRWQGRPEQAFQRAGAAASVYTSLGALNSTARIQHLTAEIALDLATATPDGTVRDSFLRLARSHVSRALAATTQAHLESRGDPNGRVLARLTEMRYQRLIGANTDRVRTIERLARRSQRLDDHALLAQSFTTLADELASHHEYGSADAMYRQALGVLDGSDLRALTIWPWRGLAWLDRQRV